MRLMNNNTKLTYLLFSTFLEDAKHYNNKISFHLSNDINGYEKHKTRDMVKGFDELEENSKARSYFRLAYSVKYL